MLLLGNSSLPLCWYTLWEHFNVVPVISEYFIITSREWNLSVTLGLILQHRRVHGFCISRKKIAQQGEGALKHYQETSTSVPCSRVNFPSLRSTSEVLVSLKPVCALTAAAPAREMPSFAQCRGGGDSEVCGERVRRSFPYLGEEVTWGLCPSPGRQQAALPRHFPCALS